MERHRALTITAAVMGAALLGLSFAALLRAQSATVSYPVLHGNVSQYGGSSVTAATSLTDAIGNPTAPLIGATGLFWDTTQWVRGKAAALATFPAATTTTSRSISGAQIIERSGRTYALHNPAAGTQASASLAAESTVRHVADCVSFSAASTTAPALTALTVNLRDGATGAGTVIWTKQVVVPASTGQNVAPFGLCGLNFVGSTNTAMTLEFSASLANLIEEVSLSVFNVQ